MDTLSAFIPAYNEEDGIAYTTEPLLVRWLRDCLALDWEEVAGARHTLAMMQGRNSFDGITCQQAGYMCRGAGKGR